MTEGARPIIATGTSASSLYGMLFLIMLFDTTPAALTKKV